MTQILVVEDEGITAANIRQKLLNAGYTVLAVVASGEEAVEKTGELQPDLVLMDIGLTGAMDGIEAVEQIRREYDLPVIYLTAYTDENTLQRAKVTGPFGYLVKPFQVRELRSTVEMALYKHTLDKKLRASEQRYRLLVENLNEGIWEIDSDSNTTFVNPRMAEMLGYSVEEMQGRHLFSFMDEAGVEICKHYLERRGQGIKEQHDFEFLRKDGARLYASLETTPIIDEQGRYVGATAGVQDITGRKQAEQEMQDSVQNLQIAYKQAQIFAQELNQEIAERKRAEQELKRRNQALTALNTIATTISQSLDLDYILKATLAQLSQVMELDAGWVQLIDEQSGELSPVIQGEISPEMVARIKAVALNESIPDYAAQAGAPRALARIGDDAAVYALTGIPLQAGDKVLGELGIISHSPRELDAQELELLEAVGHQLGVAVKNLQLAKTASELEVLQQLDRLQSELIANVSHELRTPLGLIKIFCTTLLRDDVTFDQATLLEFLQDIDTETGRLERIVDNLLNLSRIQEERLRLDSHPADAGQLVAEIIKELTPQAPQHHFVQDFPPQPLMVVFDSRYIEQVLRNLFSNAVKYSPRGGAITIRGYADQEQFYCHVSDQGIGIPALELERIFERFYRVKNEHTQNAPGVGLGLAVCRGLVEAHGGRMWVESAVNKGSTFSFSLPFNHNKET